MGKYLIVILFFLVNTLALKSQNSCDSGHIIVSNKVKYKTDSQLFNSLLDDVGIRIESECLDFYTVFGVENKQLYLDEIIVNESADTSICLDQLTRIHQLKETVKSDFSGIIELCGYHEKYILNKKFPSVQTKIHKKYILLKIKRGQIVKQKKFTGKKYLKFKNRLFNTFYKTEKYDELEALIMKENNVEDWIAETLIREKWFFYIDDF